MMSDGDTEETLDSLYGDNNNDSDTDQFTGELLIDDDENSSSESLYDDECLRVEPSVLVHQFTKISKKSYCFNLLKLLREAIVSKSHSKRFIQLIKSILPVPNNFSCTYDD